MNNQTNVNALYSLNYQPVNQSGQGQAPALQASPGAVNVTRYTPLVYTVQEAAEALHVNPKTIRRLLARGVLTASKAVRKKLIPRYQIENFLKATCDQPKPIR